MVTFSPGHLAWEQPVHVIMRVAAQALFQGLLVSPAIRMVADDPLRLPAAVERWHVDVPATFGSMAQQSGRSVRNALPSSSRLLVEAAAPELDPANAEYFRPDELIGFARDLAAAALLQGNANLLPVSKPHCKLLFGDPKEATMAGAAILDTSLPVSVLGYPTAVGPRDGAFVVVAPSLRRGTGVDQEAALGALLQEAGRRPVILINPRLGNTPLLRTFEQAYLMRPLSLGFLVDQYADRVERVSACLLRCHPHDYGVLFDASDNGEARMWKHAGAFSRPPAPAQMEGALQKALTSWRNEKWRRLADEQGGSIESP